MLYIAINNQPYQIGQSLPADINSLVVEYAPLASMLYPKEQTPAIKLWFSTLIDRLRCTHVTFNTVLIPVSELNKP